ncbi:MAG: hypothetical protein K9L70_02005 [Thiohalocapsa sp.]|jgi:hypothetical protein|nr:hypothetical protein [Thiohalocapsa sp.]MCF7991682.1 hypothetical protein [Thiohalocapsa sp.]
MKQRALDDPSLDAYTKFVLSHIDPDVLASLTEHQFECIRSAVEKAKPISKHTIDLRGVIPLFFVRFYFVLLAGRDRRKNTSDRENSRRQGAHSVLGALVLFAVVVVPVSILTLLIGYGLKTWLGVDLIEGAHLTDYM